MGRCHYYLEYGPLVYTVKLSASCNRIHWHAMIFNALSTGLLIDVKILTAKNCICFIVCVKKTVCVLPAKLEMALITP